MELDARGRRLRAALAAVLVKAAAPELKMMHERSTRGPASDWSSSAWPTRAFDLQLAAYGGRDWRANFFSAGIAHSILTGTGCEPTPWRAVQRAAWAAIPRT
jgi:hypothetical protein